MLFLLSEVCGFPKKVSYTKGQICKPRRGWTDWRGVTNRSFFSPQLLWNSHRGLAAQQQADTGRGTPEQVREGTLIHAASELFLPSWLPSSDYLLLYFPITVRLMEPRTILPFQPVVWPTQKGGERFPPFLTLRSCCLIKGSPTLQLTHI